MALMRNRRSATIIEVVMAMVILSIALPSLISSFIETTNQTIFPSNATVASFLATERMEEIVARRYRATDGYAAVTTANFPTETTVTGFTMFRRTVTVSYVTSSLSSSASDVGYKKVRVNVSWNSGTKNVAVERLFADFQ